MRRCVPLISCLVIVLSTLACSSGKESSAGGMTSKNLGEKTPEAPLPDAPTPQPEGSLAPKEPSSPYLDPESAAGQKWAEHTGSVKFVLGYENGRALAEKTSKPAMYFVTTTWCKYCRQMAKDNFDDAPVKKLLEGFVCVLVDGEAEARRARLLGAPGFPHVVFATSKGVEIARASGAQSVERFRALIQRVLAESKA
jgi:thioredoxin-related protein